MAITYTFLTDNTMKLEMAPELNGLEKVITRVRYNYVGVDENGNEGTFAGVTPMPAPNAEGYKPFKELTPEDIVSWLEATADKPHMQERIQKQIDKLLSGVVLDDDPKPVKASSCQILSPNLLELVLTEGKYHQVKRMVAAVSNRVEGLHRAKIGGLELPADLAPGQWRWLSPADLTLLMQK